MKKWKIILASILAIIVMVAVPLGVMAQSQSTPNSASTPVFKGGLAIVAPHAVLSGKDMQMTVFLRENQTPLAGVNVWAVTKDNIDAFKQALQAARQDKSVKPADKDYSDILTKVQATLLGQTKADGKITHAFADAGNYLLVAHEKGHGIDLSVLAVREMPKALVISAPKAAKVNAPVTITVHQRGSTTPVSGAGVWAIAPEKADALKAQISAAKPANQANVQASPQVDWASILDGQATKLGITDNSGHVNYTFTNPGRYILVTFQSGYVPGFSGIAIATPKPTPTQTATPQAKTVPSITASSTPKN